MRIGLILNVLDEDYQISIFKGIKEEAEKQGVEIFCIQQENSNFVKTPLLSDVLKRNIFKLSGLIYLTSVMTDIYDIQNFDDANDFFNNLPVISVGQKIEGLPAIISETDFSMKQLMEHLILEHKYKKFVFLGGPQNHPDAISREEIFKQTLEVYKVWEPQISYKIRHGLFTEEAAIEMMNDFYKNCSDFSPDAIICANDNMAIGVYKFFKMNPRLKICAVTGFDDVPQLLYQFPTLTTVRQPLEKMGKKAVETVINLIKGKKIKKLNYIESSVIYRQSCGCTTEKKSQNDEQILIEKIQTDFIKTEQQLRMLNHFAQYVGNALSFDLLRYYIKSNLEQLEIFDFAILIFEKNCFPEDFENKLKVKPFFVYHKSEGENSKYYTARNATICAYEDFFNDFEDSVLEKKKNLILKYLICGRECIGFVLYNCDDSLLSYMGTLVTTISQSIARIQESKEKEKRSEYLEQEVKKRTHQLVEANERRMKVEAEVLKISEMERHRFSNDLHDDICQRLAGISMLCRSYSNKTVLVQKSEMEELAELITDTLQATRQYAHNSFPVEVENLGLKNSISNLCNSVEKQSGIKCNYDWKLKDNLISDSTAKLNIFRIIQEALHNVMKHSKASKVDVILFEKNNQIFIQIKDDGCGIKNKETGLGFNSMQYRANQIGASFEILSEEKKGTTVQVILKQSASA